MVVSSTARQGPSEQPISNSVYQGICELVHKHSSIKLGDNKQTMLTSRLKARLLQLGLKSWDEYYRYICQGQNNAEIHTLIDLVAINHTQFFRERQHFDRLSSEILDQILAECPGAASKLLAWSAASSTGEEAYSLAITISEHLAKQAGPKPDWLVYASDISSKAIKVATTAIYQEASLNLPQPQFLQRYFKRGRDIYESKCRVKPEILDHVKIERINLFQETYPLPAQLHLIFCRNVLIYFAQDSQSQLVSRLHRMLTPGGFLVIGHCDSLACFKHDFQSLGGGVYRKSS